MDFRILGPLEVSLGSGPVEVQGAGQRALVARLLLDANRVVAADRLVDDLWVVPPRSGVKALQQRVVELRRDLEPGGARQVIHTRERGYVIELEPAAVDLHRFEVLLGQGDEELNIGRPAEAAAACRSALELWRGPPLAEFSDVPFATAAGARLEELHLGCLGKRIEAELTLGRHAELIGELKELAREHRFREGFRAQLILALYRSGRQAEALEMYRETRQILIDELGVEPSRALQELEQAMLRQDPSLDLTPAGAARPSDVEPQPVVAERSILIAPKDPDSIELLLAVAEPLTRRPRRELILTALAGTVEELDATTTMLQDHREALLTRGISARAASFTSDSVGADLVRLASAQDTDLLLTDAPAELLSAGVPPADLETIFREAPCDVATVVPGGDPGESSVSNIVVPFGGTDHDWAAVEISAWLAASHASTLTLLGTEAQPERERRDASRLLADVSLIVQRATGVAPKPMLVPTGEEAILRASEDAGFLVVGLSDRWADEGLGPVRLALARGARPPTLIARRGARPSGIAPQQSLTRYTWSLATEG